MDIRADRRVGDSGIREPVRRPGPGVPQATVGYMSLGSGFRLGNNLFLSLSAAAKLTDDATDFVSSMALPHRF